MKTVLYRWVACLAALMLFTSLGTVRGDDERDRKARAALALAGEAKPGKHRDRDARAALAFAEAVVHTAPPPKAKGKTGCTCGPLCDCCGCCDKCPTAKKATPRDALVRVSCGNGSGSGTVIWSADGRSVILTAAHVAVIGPEPRVRGGGKWHVGKLLARDSAADLAAILVEVELPAVPVAEVPPKIGATVEMYGVTSLWSKGTIERESGGVFLLGCDGGACEYSDSGDSGGGVFCHGELVGVHCGKMGSTPADVGSPYCASTKPIRTFLAKIFHRKSGKTVLVEPATVKAAPKPATASDGYDLWLIQGRYYYLPKGQQPHFAAPNCPTCPNGRCPIPR